MDSLSHIYDSAREFMAETRSLILEAFEKGLKIETKKDRSLVTQADQEAERLLRRRITERFPQHGIIGEEDGDFNVDAEYVWVLDPIDGTQSFVHGIPTFGSILAVLKNGSPVVGVIDHPALQENVHAAAGMGAFHNDRKISLPSTGTPEIDYNEVLTVCSKHQWAVSKQEHLFDRMWSKHRFMRIYYDCFALSRAVAGQTGACIETNVHLWDIAPCKVLIEEAGGRFVDFGSRNPADISQDEKIPASRKLYSVLFGKKDVVQQIEKWLAE